MPRTKDKNLYPKGSSPESSPVSSDDESVDSDPKRARLTSTSDTEGSRPAPCDLQQPIDYSSDDETAPTDEGKTGSGEVTITDNAMHDNGLINVLNSTHTEPQLFACSSSFSA